MLADWNEFISKIKYSTEGEQDPRAEQPQEDIVQKAIELFGEDLVKVIDFQD
jgi:hypothetical protein